MTGIVPFDDSEVAKRELDWIGEMARQTGLTATFIVLQHNQDPTRWRTEMDAARGWREQGAHVVPLVAGRPFGVLLGWDIRHPFRMRPSYEAIDALPRAERLETLRHADVRERILSEQPVAGTPMQLMTQAALDELPADRLRAARRRPTMNSRPTDRWVRSPSARAPRSRRPRTTRCARPTTPCCSFRSSTTRTGTTTRSSSRCRIPIAVLGLADGGAHCGTICDASMPTYVLTHWVRDRSRGPRLSLEDAVRRLSSQPAELYGLDDRGRIAEGLRADLNVIDPRALTLHAPRAVRDLPAGGTRLLQDATGYRATIVNGEVTRRDGADTGARPGRLLRNAS